ncbi:MAG: hypothetical protein ACJ8BW_08030 [Ktedonobacteraceae bacterium]
MQLPPEQTARFYRIWLALLHHVNEQQHLVPAFPAPEERNGLLPLSDEMHLRNALWADDTLRERFISANPAGLSSADLAVVASWRSRRAGSFYIVRALKKYTVFLAEDDLPRAYGVLGLSTPIEELAGRPLPVLAQTVLLPFEGRIIYDGLLQWYAVVFGPGIRARLNTEYRNAQEREGVITTLEPADVPADPQQGRTAVLARNARILQAFRKDLSSKGLSPKTVEQHVGMIEDFAQTSLLEHDPSRGLLDTRLSDVQSYLRTHGNKTVTTSFKRFVRFLEETGRMDYEEAEVLREWLKQATGEPDPRR